MHLIVDKARDEVRVVAAKSSRLPAGRTFAFSSALGRFLVRMAYARAGTVEYWRKPLTVEFPCDFCGSMAVERDDTGVLIGCVDCGYECR